jgi:DNA polymerase III subunit alpha
VRTWLDVERLVKDRGGWAGKIAGTISSRNDRRTKKGSLMAIMALSDATGSFEVIAFSEQIEAHSDVMQPGKSAILTVEASDRGEGVSLRLMSAESLEKAAERVGKELRIFVEAANCLGPIHSQLKPGGEGHVIFVIPRGASRDYEVDVPGRFRLTTELAGAVKALNGVVDVRLS